MASEAYDRFALTYSVGGTANTIIKYGLGREKLEF